MRLHAAAVFLLLVIATAGVAAGEEKPRKPGKPDPEVGRCVKRVRNDERACVRAATERCRETLETDLPGCYRSNADCARSCITEQSGCRGEPQVGQEGCKLACASDLKVERERCRVEADPKRCEGSAKVKTLQCKQKCVVDAAPAFQGCMRRFDDCLAACSKAVLVPVIVNCAAYAGGRRVADLDLPAVSDWVVKDGHFVWIGLHEPSDEILRTIQEELDLHDLAVEDALRAHQRPKLEEYGRGLFIVMRTAQWNADAHEVEMGETHLFVGPRYVVSVRHGPSVPYTQVRARCETMPALLAHGPGFVLYAIMDFIVDQYFPVLDALEEEVESLEEGVFGGTTARDTTQRIYKLKRDLIALKRAASPLIDVCNRLVRYDQGLIAEDCRPYFRDVYDHVVRINEGVDVLRELLTSALEANLSFVSIRQNEVMKTLAGWAAIFGVMTLLAGIWGMNFDYMPELTRRWGYPGALAFMAGVAGVLYWRLKRAGWL